MFRIILTSTNRLYHPGDTITGRLLVDVNYPKSFNQIAVIFIGSCYVRLTREGPNARGESVVDHYTSSEAYVDLVAPLWNSQQSPDGKLPPGQYNWPFSFNLPPTAPSSFEGSVSNIRYSLVAGNMVTDTKLQYRVEQRIDMQELMKITDYPRWLTPVHQQVCEDEERVRYLCCTSRCDPVAMTVTVPKTGFYLGESFQLHASLENGTRSRCIQMTALVEKEVCYHAEGRRDCERETILQVESDWIEPQEIRNWDPTLTIPTTENISVITTYITVCYTLYIAYGWPTRRIACIPLQLGNCQDEEETAPTVQSEPPQQPAATHPPSPQPLPPPPVPQYPPIAPQSPPPAPPPPPLPFAEYSPPLGSQLTD